jgi:hypothetical protein
MAAAGCSPARSLHDVYVALDCPGLFAIASRNADTACKVERAVNHALSDTMAEAEAPRA